MSERLCAARAVDKPAPGAIQTNQGSNNQQPLARFNNNSNDKNNNKNNIRACNGGDAAIWIWIWKNVREQGKEPSKSERRHSVTGPVRDSRHYAKPARNFSLTVTGTSEDQPLLLCPQGSRLPDLHTTKMVQLPSQSILLLRGFSSVPIDMASTFA